MHRAFQGKGKVSTNFMDKDQVLLFSFFSGTKPSLLSKVDIRRRLLIGRVMGYIELHVPVVLFLTIPALERLQITYIVHLIKCPEECVTTASNMRKVIRSTSASFGIFYWSSLEVLNVRACNTNRVGFYLQTIVLLPQRKGMKLYCFNTSLYVERFKSHYHLGFFQSSEEEKLLAKLWLLFCVYFVRTFFRIVSSSVYGKF